MELRGEQPAQVVLAAEGAESVDRAAVRARRGAVVAGLADEDEDRHADDERRDADHGDGDRPAEQHDQPRADEGHGHRAKVAAGDVRRDRPGVLADRTLLSDQRVADRVLGEPPIRATIVKSENGSQLVAVAAATMPAP